MIQSLLIASRGEIATRATPNPRHAELVSAFMAQSPRHGQPFARSRKGWTLPHRQLPARLPPPREGEVLVGHRRDQIPPRNGEGDHPQDGGGVLSATDKAFKLAKRERRSGNLPEVLIWRELRKRPGGFKFRRQHPLGEIVIDFACLSCRLAIEIDGRSHDMGDRPERDEGRDAWLKSQGFSVLRIPARLVLRDPDGAIFAIVSACVERLPLHRAAHGPPPRAGEVIEKRAGETMP